MDWDLVRQVITVRDLDLGKSWSFALDLQKGSWRAPDREAVTREYAREIEILAGVMKDFALLREPQPRLRIGNRADHPGRRPWEKRAGNKDFTDDFTCTGSTVRGDSFAATRSQCCANATQEASDGCSNQWCWGCCSFMDCDASCAMGDYGCFCGVTGTRCAGADVPPPGPTNPPGGGGGGSPPGGGGGGCSCDADHDGWVTPTECTTYCSGTVNGGYCDVF